MNLGLQAYEGYFQVYAKYGLRALFDLKNAQN